MSCIGLKILQLYGFLGFQVFGKLSIYASVMIY